MFNTTSGSLLVSSVAYQIKFPLAEKLKSKNAESLDVTAVDEISGTVNAKAAPTLLVLLAKSAGWSAIDSTYHVFLPNNILPE